MDQQTILLTLFGMMAVTHIPRVIPALALSSRDLPPVMVKWLSYVPTAVLSALLMPSLLAPKGAIDLTFNNLYFWVAVPTFAVAMYTRNFFGTVAVGMGLVAAARYFL